MQNVLVDTSAWVQLIRTKGDAATKAEISKLMLARRAMWCPIIRVELWRGTGSKYDESALADLEGIIPSLSLTDAVWEQACTIGYACRKAGRPVPTPDVIVFACARTHGAELLHRDKHFDTLRSLSAQAT